MQITCTNCARTIDSCAWAQGEGGERFCLDCSAYYDALGIGDLAVTRLLLYDNGRGEVTGWGPVVLGKILKKTVPAHRTFGSVRYKVKMLDGSLWHGWGPTRNGTYIRLKRSQT